MIVKHISISTLLALNTSLSRPFKLFNHIASNSGRFVDSSHKMSYPTISYVTVPDQEVARKLSRQLVENRLAACVNVVKGVESIYEWKGKIEQDNELLLIVKSHSSKTKQLTEFVEKNHPYDCPEVLTVEVESGSKPYLDWIHQSISKKTVEGENVSGDAQNSKE